VLHVSDENQLSSAGHIDTAPGARTGLFISEWKKVIIAAPHKGPSAARLLVYSIAP